MRGGLVGRGLAVCVVGWCLFFVCIAVHALGVPYVLVGLLGCRVVGLFRVVGCMVL